MDERLLDELIKEAAPPAGSAVSDDSLWRLIEESAQQERKRVAPIAIISVVGAMGLLGGAAAAAGPDMITHLGWTAERSSSLVVSTGDVCDQGFRVVPGDSTPVDEATLASARLILENMEIDAIDITSETAYLEKELASATWVGADEPVKYTPSGIESWARYIAVNAEFRHAAIVEGLDPELFELGAATECGEAQIK